MFCGVLFGVFVSLSVVLLCFLVSFHCFCTGAHPLSKKPRPIRRKRPRPIRRVRVQRWSTCASRWHQQGGFDKRRAWSEKVPFGLTGDLEGAQKHHHNHHHKAFPQIWCPSGLISHNYSEAWHQSMPGWYQFHRAKIADRCEG